MSHLDAIHSTTPLAEKPRLKRPAMYKVILLNDDFTPMEFVVDVLCQFFQKSTDDATIIMLNVHHKGKGLCGIYPLGIAESKVTKVNDFSLSHGHPLKSIMEKHHAE